MKAKTPTAATRKALKAAISVRANVSARVKKGRWAGVFIEFPNGSVCRAFRSRVRDRVTWKRHKRFAGLLPGFVPSRRSFVQVIRAQRLRQVVDGLLGMCALYVGSGSATATR
ncbi:hypothetical protein GCM10009081_13160 [Brevundimonas nasdae]